jgi:NAD(P)H-hydrate epimerase
MTREDHLLVSAREMAALDRQTIEEIGIPGIVLMENAARGAAEFFQRVVPDLRKRRITVVAGAGNNAGDGFVLARIFHGWGAVVRVVCLRSPEGLQGDALTNFQILAKLDVPVQVWNDAGDPENQWPWIRESDAVVDAILGTGLNSEVRGLYREIIEGINGLEGIPVLAVDIPSGLDATTGKVLGAAVRARATATFGFIKTGLVIEPGRSLAGSLQRVDIGIPWHLAAQSGVRRWRLNADFLSGWLAPREAHAHKGTAGHVAVLAGSRGKTGAATLICQGAARAGAGLVTLFIPGSLNPILEVKLTEAMTWPVAETDAQSPSLDALPEILDLLQGKQALAMGPGTSLHPSTRDLILALIGRSPCPMVLDADALTAVAPDLSVLGKAPQPVVLTPHPGEMARLSGISTREIQENRIETASEFSRRHGVVLVLKGSGTVVTSPDGEVAVNTSGTPAMASGGMGDALTGMITGFLGQGIDAYRSACLGVFVHGAAADRRFRHVASRGLLATDLLEEAPFVIGELERGLTPQ